MDPLVLPDMLTLLDMSLALSVLCSNFYPSTVCMQQDTCIDSAHLCARAAAAGVALSVDVCGICTWMEDTAPAPSSVTVR